MSGKKEKKSINLIGNSGKVPSRKKIKAKKVARRRSPEPTREGKSRGRGRSPR
tara:strand:- start:135 stop:293 length:159 start_codon:yes stop_codon:yes gene_type:complete